MAGVGKRKVLFASLQNEPVRSMMISIEERLAEAVPRFTRQFVRVPGVNESAKATLAMDIEGNPMKQETCPGITFVGVTYGKAEMLRSKMFRAGFADFLSKVWLVVRDEGQQAGPASSTCLSAMISKHAFEVWIGDHKQPVGGVAQNQELLSKLQHVKRCGLRMNSYIGLCISIGIGYCRLAICKSPRI